MHMKKKAGKNESGVSRKLIGYMPQVSIFYLYITIKVEPVTIVLRFL